jgi:hypothetical protein
MLCVESVFLQLQVMNYDDVLLLVSKALPPLLFQSLDDTILLCYLVDAGFQGSWRLKIYCGPCMTYGSLSCAYTNF